MGLSQANSLSWVPGTPTSGTGHFGSCCNAVDIFHGNTNSTLMSAHPCSSAGQSRCSGAQCGGLNNTSPAAFCDADGCDFNPRQLRVLFYGNSSSVDTRSKFTVITQFVTADNSTGSDLVSISRTYLQDGFVLTNPRSAIYGIAPQSSDINPKFCTQEIRAFSYNNTFDPLGGLKTVGDALSRGMVLALSIRDDPVSNMAWLDSTYPPNLPTSTPGVLRGECPPNPTIPTSPVPSVIFSNIRFGDIGSLGVGPGL